MATLKATFNPRHFAGVLQFRLAAGEQLGDFTGGLIAVFGTFGVQFGNDRTQPVGHLGDNLLNRLRRVFGDSLQHGELCQRLVQSDQIFQNVVRNDRDVIGVAF